jgi:uncharacterized protein YbgA (DUF1722 family)
MQEVAESRCPRWTHVHERWRQLVASGITSAALVRFHTAHKFVVLAHSERLYRELGRLVARAGSENLALLAEVYINTLESALAQPATRKRHANVLQHLMGFLKHELDREAKRTLCRLVENYRVGQLPLAVPVTALVHYWRRLPTSCPELRHYLLGYLEAFGLHSER